ncbi:hypothetical protein ARAM_002841 [Aspergillus rambellii]|uniref:SGNH hydrolase-type esterase domain-containing protein n=1 Tax=Aspergillus rambellii TaxID=308745 RepID=A0A0F8UVS8_9EURO|nr:hypothetical protein ARAM_002841 [Aspergillus rambellii]
MALIFDKVLLFGDSITEAAYDPESSFGFGSAVQHVYARKMDVVQRGFSGYNSDHAREILPHLMKQENAGDAQVKLMIVFFGTNDCIAPESKNHVPIPRYKENMRQIVQTAQGVGAKVVIVAPGPFNYHQFRSVVEASWLCDRDTRWARGHCDAAIELGKELNVPVVPLWYLIMADAGWKEGDPLYGLEELPAENPLTPYFNDGLHFLGKAYKIEFIHVMKAIKNSYPELDPDQLQHKLPLCDDTMTLDSLTAALGS